MQTYPVSGLNYSKTVPNQLYQHEPKITNLIKRQILRGCEWIVCTYGVHQLASRVTNDILNNDKEHCLVEVRNVIFLPTLAL